MYAVNSVCVLSCVCQCLYVRLCLSVCLCVRLQNCLNTKIIIGASRSEPHTTEFYAFRGILYIYIYIYISIRTTTRLLRMRQMFHVKHGVDAPPTTCMRSSKRKGLRNRCFATATDINGLDRSRLPWSVPLDRSRLPRSAIMAVQVQSIDVFLCYQRLRVSCALCNNFQAARPRQTTERRLAPLYDKS